MRASTQYGVFNYFVRDCIGRAIATDAFWDEHLRPYMDRLVPGDVFVDVGANLGFFPVYVAKFLGATVHAFEPSVELFELLKQNVEENAVGDRVILHNIGLYDRETELCRDLRFTYPNKLEGKIDYEHVDNSGGLSLKPGKDSFYSFIGRTLDSFELSNVKLIKIDTQGSEYEVLTGALETIKRNRSVVCFEYEQPRHSGLKLLEEFTEFFRELNYKDPVYLGGVDYLAVPQ